MSDGGEPAGEIMRLDKWLWHARFFKSRALASEFCETAGARIAGQPVRKAHYQLRIGDVLTFATKTRQDGPLVRVLRVLALSQRRLSPPLARELYEDLAPPVPRAAPKPSVGRREPGSGRPTKMERRALLRLKGEE